MKHKPLKHRLIKDFAKKMHPEHAEEFKRNLRKQFKQSQKDFKSGNYVTYTYQRGRPILSDPLEDESGPELTPTRAQNIGEDSLERRTKFIFEEESGLDPVQRDEVVGVDAILAEVDNYVNFLNNYLQLKELKVRSSPGLILHGASGLGKTYTARYIATASKARTVQINNFPRREAKWTPQDIHTLIHLSREYVKLKKQPLILYWDEFETVGKMREKVGAEEAETVSALTSEIEGFSGKIDDIIIIGSTNYFETLDKALIRPGRMGHHIQFLPPSYSGKIEILKFYTQKKPPKKILILIVLVIFLVLLLPQHLLREQWKMHI